MSNDLARRLVESPHWRWMPGMRLLPAPRESGQPFDGRLPVARRMSESAVAMNVPAALVEIGFTLDITDDPATEGCLLRLLEEAVARLEDETEVRVWGRDVELRHFLPARGSSRLNLAFDGPCRGENLASAILTVEHAILAAGEVRDA